MYTSLEIVSIMFFIFLIIVIVWMIMSKVRDRRHTIEGKKMLFSIAAILYCKNPDDRCSLVNCMIKNTEKYTSKDILNCLDMTVNDVNRDKTFNSKCMQMAKGIAGAALSCASNSKCSPSSLNDMPKITATDPNTMLLTFPGSGIPSAYQNILANIKY